MRPEPDLRARVGANLARFERRTLAADGLHMAAVAGVIVPGEPGGQACLLVTRRAATLRRHSGQWALPGGRVDAGESAVQAALRELEEELGLTLEAEAVLGCLDDYRTRSGYRITPVVLWGEHAGALRPNPHEVATVHRLALAELAAPGRVRLQSISQSDRPVLSLQIPSLGTQIYAPTAAVIHQLCEVCVHGRPTRVAHYEQPLFAWR